MTGVGEQSPTPFSVRNIKLRASVSCLENQAHQNIDNGDHRFVTGKTDPRTFEHQRNHWLTVHTTEDSEACASKAPMQSDCSLGGAIILTSAK